nr:MAG TPA: Cytosine specific methyltransferase [Caudoviricetes sp.]
MRFIFKMEREIEFREWLATKNNYSVRVIKDIVCRFKRADKILKYDNKSEDYIFRLDRELGNRNVKPNVKSQLKHSIRLYKLFLESESVQKVNPSPKLKVASMFSNIGVAEASLGNIGIDVIVANELEERRADLYSAIYPNSEMIVGDITDEKVFSIFVESASKKGVDVLMATPPCQGMSTAGKKNENDERNLLILPVISAVQSIKPRFVFIENVPSFLSTSIFIDNQNIKIIDLLKSKLSDNYNIEVNSIDVSDYGVPQTRERAIILLTRKDCNFIWKLPKKEKNKVTMHDAIGHLPIVDPYVKDLSSEERKIMFPLYEERRKKAISISKWHIPPHHIKRQIVAMQHTKTGMSAFDNEIYYPKKSDGTPVRGYRNTYKRQHWDRPAYTVTMDNRKISSQNNVHPGREYVENGQVFYSDPRALTLYEIMMIMSLPHNWNLPTNASEAFVRRIIGEGIPPLFVKKVFENLLLEMKE